MRVPFFKPNKWKPKSRDVEDVVEHACINDDGTYRAPASIVDLKPYMAELTKACKGGKLGSRGFFEEDTYPKERMARVICEFGEKK